MFQKGNECGKIKKKPRYNIDNLPYGKLTALQSRKLSHLDDIQEVVLINIYKYLTGRNKVEKLQVTLTCMKYLFPTKKESIQLVDTVEDYLKRIASGELDKITQAPNEIPLNTAIMVMPQSNTE